MKTKRNPLKAIQAARLPGKAGAVMADTAADTFVQRSVGKTVAKVGKKGRGGQAKAAKMGGAKNPGGRSGY